MSRTPLIRRLTAIIVAVLIPFGAAASTKHAATPPQPSARIASVLDDDAGDGGMYRSSWS
jgi:hypothetical protein